MTDEALAPIQIACHAHGGVGEMSFWVWGRLWTVVLMGGLSKEANNIGCGGQKKMAAKEGWEFCGIFIVGAEYVSHGATTDGHSFRRTRQQGAAFADKLILSHTHTHTQKKNTHTMTYF